MKIISKDNFDRETISDQLIAENVPEFYAETIKNFLNDKYSSDTSTFWAVVKPDDYKLYIYEP